MRSSAPRSASAGQTRCARSLPARVFQCAPQLRAQRSAGQTRCARSLPARVSFNCILSGGEGGIDSAAAATSGLKPSHLQCAPQLRAQRSAGQTRCARSLPARVSFNCILSGGEGGIDSAAAATSGLKPSHLQCAPQLRAQRSAGQTRCARSLPARVSFNCILSGGEGGIDSAAAATSGLKPSHLQCAPQLRAQRSAGQTRCARSLPARVSFNCILSGGEGGIDSAAAATSGLKPSHLRCAPQLRAQRSAGQTRCARSLPARISFDYVLSGGEGGIRTREARSKGLLP